MIPLFSPNGVDTSLVVPVYIGVLLAFFMTERYGWVFSGLVIPGYMAPIFANYPLSGIAIVVESVLTYLIVRGCFEASWWHGAHTPPFGRERFLGIVVVGVAVRLLFEEFAVPFMVTQVLGGGVTALIDSRQMGAIGLVIVPLLANLMWRPGVTRGLCQVGVLTAAVWFLIGWVVQPFTNFSLSVL